MISTGTLMLLKALLTATALLGLCVWQLAVLRRLRREREDRQHQSRSPFEPGEADQRPTAHRAPEPEDSSSPP